MNTEYFFEKGHTLAWDHLVKYEQPWEILPTIKDIVMEIAQNLDKDKYYQQSENVWIAKSAIIYPNVYIKGPCIIGENTEVRPSAFIRGNALIGDNCVIGNSTEVKNSIIFDNVQVPHFNYVGDSILGFKSHMGAGAVTSNVKSDKGLVKIKKDNIYIDTGLKKFGAILGDRTEVGCNSVLCPGSVIGKDCIIYPLSRVRGFLKERSIFKNENNIINRNM